MTFNNWSRSVRKYWKSQFFLELVGLSQRILGNQPFEGFPRFLWWFSFGIILLALTINGIVLTVRQSSILETFPVDRNTTRAVCLCNSLVPNLSILSVTPNQTAFGDLGPIYNSSMTLAKIWNSGSTFISGWTVPLDWNGLTSEAKQTFLNQLRIMQTTIQLTLILFGNGTNAENALSQIVELEIDAYIESFIYLPQPFDLTICPTATCVLSGYPSGWTLFMNFLTVIVSSNLVVYVVVYFFIGLVWNIIELRKLDKGEILEG